VSGQQGLGGPPAARRLLIMGPPGAGKGTQAVAVAAALGVPAISTGDMFRALQHASTPLAVKVRTIMADGGYVDDDTTNAIIADRLAASDCADGFLLDGYPRTLSQVAYLDELLAGTGTRLDAVISLHADEEEIVTRLVARGQHSGRSDDTAETIRTRLAVYREQTAPLLDTYGRRGLLLPVDGIGAVEEVGERIAETLRLHADLLTSTSPTSSPNS
jgi:adenylate kinase